MSEDLGARWGARRPAARLLHLDTAAAGRSSRATLEATAAHARLEAETGAYVAQALAGDVLERLRADVGGLIDVPPAGVAFVESASRALIALLDAWPRLERPRVAVVDTEWGPNLDRFARYGYEPVPVSSDAAGRLDLDALRRALDADRPGLVHLTQVVSHRAVVHPVADAAALCRAAGVPLWVDAAQAVGHVDAATGADAVYATSRKWLTGPRGVGFLGIAERHWAVLDPPRVHLAGDLPPVHHLESHEANVAGRVGLATAVAEFLDDGPAALFARLAEVGRLTRAALADVPGWSVVDPGEGGGAITALRARAGQDVPAEAARLRAGSGVLVTAGAVARAPWDMTEPLLRVSPHVDVTADQLERLARALAA